MYNLSKLCFVVGTSLILLFSYFSSDIVGYCFLLCTVTVLYTGWCPQCTMVRWAPRPILAEGFWQRLTTDTNYLWTHTSTSYWEITNKQSTTCEQQRTITPTTAQPRNLFPIGEGTVLINIWYWLVTASETQIYRGSFLKYECFPQQFFSANFPRALIYNLSSCTWWPLGPLHIVSPPWVGSITSLSVATPRIRVSSAPLKRQRPKYFEISSSCKTFQSIN